MRIFVLVIASLLPLETQPDRDICETGLLQRYGPGTMQGAVRRQIGYWPHTSRY